MNVREMLCGIGLGDPYAEFAPDAIGRDLQGWASNHPYFPSLIAKVKPNLIIEVGTWKGASAIGMARHALAGNPDVAVLCIDTWLGSNETLWSNPQLRPLLKLRHGYPSIYKQFLANVILEGLTHTVFPLPMTSLAAAELLARYQHQSRSDLY